MRRIEGRLPDVLGDSDELTDDERERGSEARRREEREGKGGGEVRPRRPRSPQQQLTLARKDPFFRECRDDDADRGT